MNTKRILEQILDNLGTVVKHDDIVGTGLWKKLVKIHPADIAQFLSHIEKVKAKNLFVILPKNLKLEVFSYLDDYLQIYFLSFLNNQERSELLETLPLDELVDFFDELSDEELRKYIKLIPIKNREKVLSLMQFDPESAGGMMNTDIVTLMPEFTIEQSISALHKIQPPSELHPHIYITDCDQHLLGHIEFQDLVLKDPCTKLSSILKKNALVVHANEDREKIAQEMIKYKVMSVPVVNKNNIFLGVIPSDALVDVLEQEAAEDVYKISAVTPIKNTYFETSFFQLFYQRSSILIGLLLLQTFSQMIIQRYESILDGFLIFFTTMIASTGGNTSSQTSALAIQGMVSGEITETNMSRFIKREFIMAGAIGLSLAVVSFLRVLITTGGNFWGNMTVSLSLGIIVLVSVMLGSLLPLVLQRIKLDPALSAGPFLATLMDIFGLLIYCFVAKLIFM